MKKILLTGIAVLFFGSFAYADEECFGGVGIEITLQNGRLFIVSIIKDSPAEKSGLLAEDEILNVDGEVIQGKTMLEIIRMLRGDVGEPVLLTLYRQTVFAPFDEEIVRGEICFEPNEPEMSPIIEE